MSVERKKQRIHELDYIRAISALFIVLFHYTTQYGKSIGHLGNWPVSVSWGGMAVNTFFLLTGYLTVCHYSGSTLEFGYKRWARLWPTFAVCVMITSLAMAAWMPERLRSIPEILLNLTMMPSYLGARAVDGVYWTLAIEVFFYFWIAVILRLVGKNRKQLLGCLYIWALAAVCTGACTRLHISLLPVKLLRIAAVTEHLAPFVMGVLIYLQNTEKTASVKEAVPLYLLSLAGMWLERGTNVTLWTVGWGVLIWLITAGKLRLKLREEHILHKGLVFLAGISYPLYLLHQFIGYAIIQKLEKAGCLNQLWMLVPVTLSILLAAGVHYAVEQPLGRRLSGLYRKWCAGKEKQ